MVSDGSGVTRWQNPSLGVCRRAQGIVHQYLKAGNYTEALLGNERDQEYQSTDPEPQTLNSLPWACFSVDIIASPLILCSIGPESERPWGWAGSCGDHGVAA